MENHAQVATHGKPEGASNGKLEGAAEETCGRYEWKTMPAAD